MPGYSNPNVDPNQTAGHWNPDGTYTNADGTIAGSGPGASTPSGGGLQSVQYGVNPGRAPTAMDQYAANPSWAFGHPTYGQVPGGANVAAQQLAQQGASYQGRQASNLYNEGAAAPALQPYIQRNADARAQQIANLSTLQNAAAGNAPSAARIQMGQGLDSSLSNAYANSRAGGTPMGATLAQNAATPGLNNIVAQGGAGRAQELNAAQNTYQGALSGLSRGDIAQQGLENSMGIEQAKLNQAMQGENSRMQLGLTGMGEQALEDQLASDTGASTAAQGYATQASLGAFNNQQQTTNALISGGFGAASGGLQSYMQNQAGSGEGGGGY